MGLIDEIGALNDAKRKLIKLTMVDKPIWQEEDKFEKAMEKFLQQSTNIVIQNLWGLKAF